MATALWFSLGFNIGFVSAAAMIMLRRRPTSKSELEAGQELEPKEKFSADREPYIPDDERFYL